MSAWQKFMEEKRQIEALISSGYAISEIKEQLDGDVVYFVKPARGNDTEVCQLKLENADSRKYVGSVLMAQLRDAPA